MVRSAASFCVCWKARGASALHAHATVCAVAALQHTVQHSSTVYVKRKHCWFTVHAHSRQCVLTPSVEYWYAAFDWHGVLVVQAVSLLVLPVNVVFMCSEALFFVC